MLKKFKVIRMSHSPAHYLVLPLSNLMPQKSLKVNLVICNDIYCHSQDTSIDIFLYSDVNPLWMTMSFP